MLVSNYGLSCNLLEIWFSTYYKRFPIKLKIEPVGQLYVNYKVPSAILWQKSGNWEMAPCSQESPVKSMVYKKSVKKFKEMEVGYPFRGYPD